MNKETSEIVNIIETYLKEAQSLTPDEIGFNITKLLKDRELVSDEFAIEVIPLNDSYMLRTRNQYTSLILGAMPSFCKECGKLLGGAPCAHEKVL
jgi:hypothetical protein